MIRLSLRAKVLLFTMAIVAILLLTSHLVTNTLVASGLRAQLEKRAELSVDNFGEWISARKEQILASARNLAESDMLPRAVDWTEPNYLGSVLQIQLTRREPDLLMVESTKSGWVYQIIDNPLENGGTLPLRAFQLPEQRWQSGLTEVVLDGRRLILTVGVPIRLDMEILGLLTVGLAIDGSVISDLRYATGCDQLSVLTGGELLMSTYSNGELEAIPKALPDRPVSGKTYDIRLGEVNYLSRVTPLTSATGETVAIVLIQFSDAEAQRLLSNISNALNLTALLAFLVFSLISIVFSGRVTTKLKLLVGHASALGEGRYEEQVNVEASDEVGLLARSFEDLRLKLRERTRELVSANEDLDRRVREIGILNRVMVAIASNLPMEEVFALISREAGSILPVDYSYLVLRVEREPQRDAAEGVRGETLRLLAWHAEEGSPRDEPPLHPGSNLAEEALRRREMLFLGGLDRGSRMSDEAWMASGGLHSACVLPLLSDEAAVGAICLAGFRQQVPDTHTSNLLAQLATEITIALQRMRLNEELQLIESRLSRLFDSVRDGIFQTDAEGNIVFVNAAAQTLFGVPEGEASLEGTKFHEMITDESRREILLERLRQYGYVTNFPATLARADGSVFEAELSVNFTDDEVGRRGIEGIVRDVTGRNELERQLLRSERLASMGQIAAGVAHEINNPLGIVLGFTQDLRSSKSETDPEQESLRVIEQETERCARIVRDLLDLARAGETKHEPVDVSSLMGKTLKLYALQMRDRRIELKTEFGEVPPVLGDERQLQQIFMNIIQNSINAMEGKRKGLLKVGLERRGTGRDSQVAVRIDDNGRGIPPADVDRIFDPFFSTHKNGGGTGLGLFIVHRLVDAQGGSISVKSREGRGTSVTITLPAAG